MKILIVGAEEVYSIENYYIKYLRDAGVEITVFPAQTIFYQLYRSLVSKMVFRLGLSSIYAEINEQFKTRIEGMKPDIVWIFKGMEIFPATLKWIHSRGIKLVNYNPDNPFVFSGRGSGNDNVTNSIPLYDLHFTYNLEVKERLEKDLGCKTSWLPFGFDIDPALFDECDGQIELNQVCFVGNPDRHRVKFIEALLKEGVAISLYGNVWGKFISHSRATVHQPVYGHDLWKTVRKYRLQLNLMRIHNLNSHNMRTFEVPGVGGIMLAQRTAEHAHFFKDREEAFYFSDTQECASLIRELLNLPANEIRKIRFAARERSMNSGYHYKHRAAQSLAEMRKLT